MKEAIVGIIMIILLLIFPLQTMRDAVINAKLEAFDAVVHSAINIARTDGYFTPENEANLRSEIKRIFPDAEDHEIVINVTRTPKYRTDVFDERELINYEILVTVKKVIFMGDFLGIPPAQNSFVYGKKGFVPSERLP